MTQFVKGQKVLFKPARGGVMEAVVVDTNPPVSRPERSNRGIIAIQIAKDPFPVEVKKSQVSPCDQNGKPLKSKKKSTSNNSKKEKESTMSTDTKPSARELRNEAKGLGVEDYDEMSRKELVAAIKAARKQAKKGTGTKAKSKKAKTEKVSAAEAEEFAREHAAKKSGKSTKKAAKKGSAAKAANKSKPAAKKAASKPAKSTPKSESKASSNGSGDNPFRKGSNLHIICALLLKGGKREVLAEKLSAKVDLHPYSGNDISLTDYDKRILLGAQTLRDKHGFKIERSGRGLEGKIKVVPGGKSKR